MVMSDENEDFADSLEEDAETAEKVAKSLMIMNDGIEDLADN
jgi:hypothetical protein